MIHKDESNFPYYESLDEIKGDGLTPVKVKSVIEFFTLAGKKSTLIKENFVPIPDLKYAVLGTDSRYYVRDFRQDWTVDMLFFYRKSIDFSGADKAVENLQRYVYDEKVWLLLNSDQVNATSAMLARVYNAKMSDKGKLPYRLYVEIAELSLKREDFADLQKSLIGYKTALKIMDDTLSGLFKQAYDGEKRV